MEFFPEYKKDNELSREVKGKLILFRRLLGQSVTITSGWTNGIGHKDNSEHYTMKDGCPFSEAVDVSSKANLLWMFCCAVMAGFDNIGIYPAFNGLHLGVRKGEIEKKWIGLGIDSTQKYLSFTEENVKKYLK